MKKLFAMLLALTLLMTAAFAETAPEAAPAAEAWYELSNENTVLTVRLPIADAGMEWAWEISAPEALELLTQETTEGEPALFAASFASFANMQSGVSLILRYGEPGADKPVETRVIDMAIAEDNTIALNSVLLQTPTADWFELSDDGCIVTVRQNGSDWTFEILDPDMIELITAESETDFAASFMATMTKAGNTEIYVNGADANYTLNIFVNEAGVLSVSYAQSLIILQPAAE